MTQPRVTGTEPEQTYNCSSGATDHSCLTGWSKDRQERQRGWDEGPHALLSLQLADSDEHLIAVVYCNLSV